MPLVVEIECPRCEADNYWVETDGRISLEARGCLGAGCQLIYQGRVDDGLEIGIQCPKCLRQVEWTVTAPDDTGDIVSLTPTACPGAGCQEIYRGRVRQVDDDDADRLRDQIGTW